MASTYTVVVRLPDWSSQEDLLRLLEQAPEVEAVLFCGPDNLVPGDLDEEQAPARDAVPNLTDPNEHALGLAILRARERPSDAEVEAAIDRRVQRRLATDREYRFAETAEQQAEREDEITRQVERELGLDEEVT